MTNSTANALSPASAATELYSPRRWVYTVLELPSAPSKSRDAQVLTDIDELSLRGSVPVFTVASNTSGPVRRRLLAFRTKAEYAAFIRILHSVALAGGASPEFLAALLPKPGMIVHHAQNSEMGIVYGLLGRYGFMDLPVTAAAEPPKHVYTVMPSIHVITTLSPYETHGHAVFTGVRDKLTDALHKFGFYPEDAEIELVHVADGDDEHEDDEDWRYTTGKMVFKGRPGQELQAFKALLAYLTQHQDNLNIHIEPTWARGITESFVHGLEHPGHYTPAVVTIGAAEPPAADFFSTAIGHAATLHVQVPFACLPAAETPNNSVEDWLRYDVQNAAKASIRASGLQHAYVYIDIPLVHDGSKHQRRYLVYNWLPRNIHDFKAGLPKLLRAIAQQFPDLNQAEAAQQIVTEVRRHAYQSAYVNPRRDTGIVVEIPGGVYALHLPDNTVSAAAEPRTGGSQYRRWFESQTQPDAERNDINLRYNGMDLTLVSLYTPRKYKLTNTSQEPVLTLNFFSSSVLLHTPSSDTRIAAAPDFQRTMLAVLREFDKQVTEKIRFMNQFVFHEKYGDVRGYIENDALKVRVTERDAPADATGPDLVFPVSKLRDWIWNPGRNGWHDNLLPLCAEAWNSYKKQNKNRRGSAHGS